MLKTCLSIAIECRLDCMQVRILLLLQALVNAIGLNTGMERQTIQPAAQVAKKLHALGSKSPQFWIRMVGFLPRGAKARFEDHTETLNWAVANGSVGQRAVQGSIAAMRRHIVVSEVVAWYATDRTRMRDHHLFDFGDDLLNPSVIKGTSVIPPLPQALPGHAWRTGTIDGQGLRHEEDSDWD